MISAFGGVISPYGKITGRPQGSPLRGKVLCDIKREENMEYAKRKNIRLPEYDYSQQGGYFVTVCTHERKCTLSQILPGTEIKRADVKLSELGKITNEVLPCIAEQYGFILNSYVIMPNHIHLILIKQNAAEMTVG